MLQLNWDSREMVSGRISSGLLWSVQRLWVGVCAVELSAGGCSSNWGGLMFWLSENRTCFWSSDTSNPGNYLGVLPGKDCTAGISGWSCGLWGSWGKCWELKPPRAVTFCAEILPCTQHLPWEMVFCAWLVVSAWHQNLLPVLLQQQMDFAGLSLAWPGWAQQSIFLCFSLVLGCSLPFPTAVWHCQRGIKEPASS